MSPAPPRHPVRGVDGLIRADLCILGAGPGGLSVAAGAAQMGASVVLVEKGAMGGDCLNTGCVPSKALIAAGRAAHALREATRFGLTCGDPQLDFAALQAHVQRAIATIAPHDSEERFTGLGVMVLKGTGRFVDPETVTVDDARIRARRFVISTGSHPVVPPVPGLDSVPFLTNETVFTLAERPRHLAILGGGPIGCELAQAFTRLGIPVTLIEQARLLSRETPDAVALVRAALTRDGVTLCEGHRLIACRGEAGAIHLTLESPSGVTDPMTASHLLVAVGRRPAMAGLGLEAAGITTGPAGITVNSRLRTSNRRVFAIGDVTGAPQFTHRAGYEAGIVIRNALFGQPARADLTRMPRVTYTAPELAQIGLDESEARQRHGSIRVLEARFDGNDRAIAGGETDGWIRVIADRRGRILGVTLVGPEAGELIGLWSLAMSARLRIGAVAGLTLPYPTLGEISKRAAGQFFAPTLFGPWTRRLVGLIQRFLP
jgi:pyruvate/2-oxoglutarate dehydrogenase complex dihydrolipoamide dehydrogenase (E3) component